MKKYIIKFLLAWGINAFLIYMFSMYIAEINYDSGQILALVSFVLAVLSIIASPFLKLLTLSFYIFAPLMLFVFFSAVFFVAPYLVSGFEVGYLQNALFMGAVAMLANFVLSLIIK